MNRKIVQHLSLNFNELRKKYGDLLIKLKKNKIPTQKWHKYIFKYFNEKDISFLYGTNIQNYLKDKFCVKTKNLIYINVGKGTRIELSKNSSRLLLSPQKAGLITWICTDGYLGVEKRGYYIRIRDADLSFLPYLKNLVSSVYGNVHIGFSKIRNKNAFEATISSKEIVSDMLTYTPLTSSKEWSIPIQWLDKEGIKEVLKILSFTEGSPFIHNRTRMVEFTLIRKDFSGGWKRYKLGISTRENLEKFKREINFIPNTLKYKKFRRIMNGYKEYHNLNCKKTILNIIRQHPSIMRKDILKLTGLNRSTVSRNLKKLRESDIIDYRKGKGNARYWSINFT